MKKLWGKSVKLVDTQYYSKYEININKQSYCSLHYHQHKANKFTVVAGIINIVKVIGPLEEHIELNKGDVYVIPSMVPHIFYSTKACKVIEEYYPDRISSIGTYIMKDDIVRITKGGTYHKEFNLMTILDKIV